MSDLRTDRQTIQDLANAELDEMKRKSYGTSPDPQPCAGCAALLELVCEASDIMQITYAGNFPAGIDSFLTRAHRATSTHSALTVRPCPPCSGSGSLPDMTCCPLCGGGGKVVVRAALAPSQPDGETS
jgi:RecJ-like exonuclease